MSTKSLKNIKVFYFFIITFVLGCFCFSCSTHSKEIIQQLNSIKGKGILFGHQDDLAYGISWKYVDGQSDVKRIAGDYPAIFGWELGGLEQGNKTNLDSVPFDKMKSLAIKAYEMGGINTFSWHPFSVIDGASSWDAKQAVVKHVLPQGDYHNQFLKQLDRIGLFLQSMRKIDGKPMPFIFRPWHEMDGGWFWWGDTHCAKNEYKELFRFTVDFLRNKYKLSQMVIAYSPDCNFTNEEEYLQWYPGDKYVDILGMDNYYDLKTNGEVNAIKKMHVVINLANKKNKLSALTETGLENVTDSKWYSQKLGCVLNDSIVKANLSYTMVWRNDPDVHYFFPYPGQKAEADARGFLEQKHIWLLGELKAKGNCLDDTAH